MSLPPRIGCGGRGNEHEGKIHAHGWLLAAPSSIPGSQQPFWQAQGGHQEACSHCHRHCHGHLSLPAGIVPRCWPRLAGDPGRWRSTLCEAASAAGT
jgi:hypothetical protein